MKIQWKPILLISAILLSGCTTASNNSQAVSSGIKSENTSGEVASSSVAKNNGPFEIVEISVDQLREKIDNKETFALYAVREGCHFCQALDEYIEETKAEHDGITVYQINTTDLKLYREDKTATTLKSDTEQGKQFLEYFPYFLYTPAVYKIIDGKPIEAGYGFSEENHTVSVWQPDSTINWEEAKSQPVWDFFQEAQAK